MNKLNRMLMTYLYTDKYVSPALIGIAILSCIYLLGNILLLHLRNSNRFMIINYTVFNYVLILMFSFLTETLLGMVMLGSLAVFLFVYMHVLMCYILAIIAPHSRDIARLFPLLYSAFFLGNLIKVFIVDSYRQSFQAMVFVFLVIQGLGFLFITGVNIKKLRQHFMDYAAAQQKMMSAASSVSHK
jgi:hypothetical protein